MTLDYSGKDIQILRGLEPVRMRPGMYIGNTSVGGLHHLFAEVLDNAVDEALNGFCSHITVELLPDNWVTVTTTAAACRWTSIRKPGATPWKPS